jgi:nitroreductase
LGGAQVRSLVHRPLVQRASIEEGIWSEWTVVHQTQFVRSGAGFAECGASKRGHSEKHPLACKLPLSWTMSLLDIIRSRHSSRVLFDPAKIIPSDDFAQILEAARWAPTAHNMQNFEVVVVDDRNVLAALASIESETSQVFVEENFAQLSFSEEELRRKKVGLLASMFPPSWRTPGQKPHLDEEHAHSVLGDPMRKSSAVLVVLYDSRKRAPASAGDVLGLISLGCVLENMWLVAESLGIGFQVQSALSSERVERQVQALLGVPDHFRVGFAVRLGYPAAPVRDLRIRRDISDFVHRNRFGRTELDRP